MSKELNDFLKIYRVCSIDRKFNFLRKNLSCNVVETIHTGRPLRYRVQGFGQSAQQLKFNINSDKEKAEASLEKTITVEEYFAQKYKPLKYPHLPCVDARNGDWQRAHWLPMEAVKVKCVNK